jgi:pantoate--beta-alanine ligase
MRVIATKAECRAARAGFGSLGFAPTMGFLHEGHLSLVRRAKAECGAAAASIFVNPAQFGPQEDLSRYPRDLAGDLEKLERAGADFVFVPEVAEIYPPGFAATVSVGRVTEGLEGAERPGHFDGVATVVTKLLNIVQPSRAYFGQKDAQQAVVIRKLAADLDLPVEIVICPIIREPDGLAMSSRNVYLSPEQRAVAPVLYRALRQAEALYRDGIRDAEPLRAAIRGALALLAEPDYVSVAHPATLVELDEIGPDGALVSLAVRFGTTRLIDNVLLGTAA